jgi:hypothetical protein
MVLKLGNHIWVSSDSESKEDDVVKCDNHDFMKRSDQFSYLSNFVN